MTSDSKGVMYIWLIKHEDSCRCVVRWVNKHSMEIDIEITAVDSNYNEETGEFLLFLADAKG